MITRYDRGIIRRRFQQWHYEAVAEVLLDLKSSMLVTVKGDTEALWRRTVDEFAHMFLTDSNRDIYGAFKQDTFYKACGYLEEDQQ